MNRQYMLRNIYVIDPKTGSKTKLSDLKLASEVLSDEQLEELYNGLKQHGRIGTMELVKRKK